MSVANVGTRLVDKVAIITGGARGIGKAIAACFLGEGAKLAIWDINEESGQKAITDLSSGGHADHLLFQKVDTTDLEAVTAAAAATQDHFGRIDILINNAGITRDASLKKMTADQWQQVIDVNLTGVFNCTKAVFPHLVEAGGGRIINAASVVAHTGNFGQTNYVAAKAGLIGMTKTWARELGRKKITVNAIAPGFIKTEMIETVPDAVIEHLVGRTPLGRLGEPLEVAQAYLFLASDEAAYVTGTVLNVDGGLVM
ncbi:MAG: 3-oxoacyl-ACP reductase FabG [Bacteroidota bacterium]